MKDSVDTLYTALPGQGAPASGGMSSEPPPLELSILMPCLNEAETLATCVRKAQAFLHASGIAGEVVVSDNGSTDGSQQIALDLGARVVPVPVRGYGAALMAACGSHGPTGSK